MIPVSRPHLTQSDIDAVKAALEAGYLSGEAPIVGEFESRFAAAVGREYGIAVANGSVALDLAMHALNLEPGDEVLVPSFTIASCLFAILRTGATPVFVDSDPTTWNMSPEHFVSLVTPRTRALLAVHIYGLPIDLDPVLEVCRAHSIAVIEDAAESHTVTYKGRQCGSFGVASTFSFYPNKAITTGEGGMVVTDDSQFRDRLKMLRNLAFRPPPGRRFIHDEIGWNFRMSSLQAALGNSQLNRMTEVTAEKRRIGLQYAELLSDHELITMQPSITPYAENKYWVAGVLIDQRCDAVEVANQLRARGVDTRPFFYPLHQQPLLGKYGLAEQSPLPVAERLGRDGIYLPSFVGITDADIARSAEELVNVIELMAR
jgi:perosamine synthetase